MTRAVACVWTGTPEPVSAPSATPTPAQGPAPLAYTPPYLAEKILTSRGALEGERKQVTVLFADLKDSTEIRPTSTRRRPAAPGPSCSA